MILTHTNTFLFPLPFFSTFSVYFLPLLRSIWCDYFVRYNTPANMVAKATAYLFKIPEGAALGVDPGFHHQMDALKTVLQQITPPSASASKARARTGSSSSSSPPQAEEKKKMGVQEMLHKGLASGIINEEQVAKLRALMH